ncbi:CaiB/BaiF CoA-transferase family protein [Inquilinus sp. Marseille-Q2685]|uniref:CaiB/BaiF CoA transferase family protein n=1 Tax=Inquilinus sp. Marseille-Q2685 TaxID=2866581 RepID=UPI001CE4AA38|nr:CoA transferase [Inquilinus sp. Marseille-Q2685]
MAEARPARIEPERAGPLSGIRVLDLSRVVAGNALGLELADFGAEVIKVEPPGGDPLRDWQVKGHSLYWKELSRNKLSVVLDLRKPEGMAALERLIPTADVMIENFRPGVLEEMGLAPDRLQAMAPDLILVRISGFGQTGPASRLPGFGTLVEAMSGFASRNGFADREPVLPPLALADMIAGLHGAKAVLAALRARDRGMARGQVIDLSLLEAMYSVLGPEAGSYAVTRQVKERTGSASGNSAPRNVYKTRDGRWIAMSGSTDRMAKRILLLVGGDALARDPRFATNADRVRNRAVLDAIIGEWIGARDRDTALAVFRAEGITVGPVHDIADFMADEHVIEREVVVSIPDPDLGPLPVHNVLPRLSATPGAIRRLAPAVGADAEDVLRRAGFSDEEIAGLRAAGALG